MVTKRKLAIEALSAIAESTDDRAALAHLRRLKLRLGAKPMDRILSFVPGGTIAARARALGVTRTTYYSWLSGVTRPRGKTASLLSKITGFDIDEIRGRNV